jgi:serine/threonine-protein kinase
MGGIDDARAILEELVDRSRLEYVPPACIAWIHIALGQEDDAFAWLEKAYDARDYELEFLACAPVYDPLRDDPRFDDLLRRVGLDKE